MTPLQESGGLIKIFQTIPEESCGGFGERATVQDNKRSKESGDLACLRVSLWRICLLMEKSCHTEEALEFSWTTERSSSTELHDGSQRWSAITSSFRV